MLGMTLQSLRNLLSRPATRPFPAKPRDPFPAARGEIVNDVKTCIFCSLCAKKCPSLCITVTKEEDKGTWTWDPFACVYCSTCVEVCPTGALSEKQLRPPAAPAKSLVEHAGIIEKKAKK